MFIKEDTTYNDIRRKSLEKWLDEMLLHDDIAVRCGVPLVKQYIEYLETDISRLKESNTLKDNYLKKLKSDHE